MSGRQIVSLVIDRQDVMVWREGLEVLARLQRVVERDLHGPVVLELVDVDPGWPGGYRCTFTTTPIQHSAHYGVVAQH